ncbi:MAG: hypothetical protein ACK5TE_12960 [Pseudomonadota bacterium]|jgi:hypothetical protein
MRRLISINFLLSAVAVLAWYGWLVVSGLSETDPNILRANRVPLGAAFLILVEVGLLALYLLRRDLCGLARVFAALLGVIGLLQSVAVPLINQALQGTAFPTAGHVFLWYVYGSHLLFALAGVPATPGTSTLPVSPDAIHP